MMKNRIIAIIAIIFFAFSLSCLGADQIPPKLVGVWVSDNAVLKGALLFEGQALYLGADGVGAMVGGPPPIGVRIVATYNANTNVIDFKMTERGKVVGTGSMVYDPVRNTIGGNKQKTLHRRFDELTNSTRKALGLEPMQ